MVKLRLTNCEQRINVVLKKKDEKSWLDGKIKDEIVADIGEMRVRMENTARRKVKLMGHVLRRNSFIYRKGEFLRKTEYLELHSIV